MMRICCSEKGREPSALRVGCFQRNIVCCTVAVLATVDQRRKRSLRFRVLLFGSFSFQYHTRYGFVYMILVLCISMDGRVGKVARIIDSRLGYALLATVNAGSLAGLGLF